MGREDVGVPAEPGIFEGTFPAAQALEKLRNRLLDLSIRNRLLNYRHPRGRSAQIVDVDFNGVFNRLVDGKECVFRWIPEPGPLEFRGQRPDARSWAAEKHGINVSIELAESNRRLPVNDSSARSLWVLQYPPELTRLLHNIARDARLAIEETGTNMLYLVFGFLEFYDAAHSDRPLLAPLIAVPVSIGKKGVSGGYNTYEVAYTGDDIRENLTLREKLRHEFNLNLPAFDEDRHGEDAESYLEDVADIVRTRPNWKVKRQLTLAMLSFGKLALWAELDPEKWPGLLDHEIVRGLFQGNTWDLADGLEEIRVDELETFDQLIYEADSSQHEALINVLKGRTLVVNGPPGTGKSQTITNIIASSLVAGKSVLFVAEKLAALEVVKTRLKEAGLGDFCLELHSHKTQKKKLLEDLDFRMKAKYRVPAEVVSKRKSLLEKRQILRQYVETLNMRLGNELGKTVFDVFWAADRRRADLGEMASQVEGVTLPFAVSTLPEQFDRLRTLIEGLSRHYSQIRRFSQGHPWFGFFPTAYPAGFELKVKNLLEHQSSVARELQAAIDSVCKVLQVTSTQFSHCRSWAQFASLLETLGRPPEAPRGLIAALFSAGQARSVQSVLDELRKRIKTARTLERAFHGKIAGGTRVTEMDLSSARVHVAALDQLSIADRRLAELRELPRTLRMIAGQLKEVLGVLAQLAEIADLHWEGTIRDISHIRLVANIAFNAPVALLPFRSRSYETPWVGEQCAKARKKAFELTQLRARLKEMVYLDQEVDLHELQRAVIALRQGDGIFKWFKGDWRRARKLHLTLSRSKEKKSAKKRAEELSDVARLFNEEKAFNTSVEYASAFGQIFAGVTTDWDKVDQLATWYRTSQQALLETEVPAPVLDLTNISMTRLGQLKARHKLLDERHEVLGQIRTEIVKCLGERFMVSADSTAREKNWNVLTAELTQSADMIDAAVRMLGTFCHSECSGADAAQALVACARHPQAIESVCEYIEAREVLGSFFSGLDTNVDVIETAYLWGMSVMQSTLPVPLKSAILRSTDPMGTFTAAMEGANGIAALWESAQRFSKNLSTLGDFREHDWYMESDDEPSLIAARCDLARTNLDGLLAWSQYNWHRQEAIRHDLMPFLTMLEQGQVSAQELTLAFEFCFFHSIAISISHSRPELSTFSGTTHEQIRAQFGELDREIIKMTGRDFASRIARAANVPEGSAGYSAADYTEKQLLLREINKQKKHIPIRQLLKRAGRAIRAYKPCFMMSPLSVAHYLEPGTTKFDLVVMDEASQIRPEDAIGAVARGTQIVVVGDPKQLPPTNFFDRMTDSGDDDEDEEVTVDAMRGTESILDVFQQLYPSRSLNWHYRSRHQSLIAFSNRHFYENRLVVFPAPYPSHASLGLQYHHITNGSYASRQNLPEAMQVVDAAVKHMLTNPEQSLGIVTLAITQRDLIEMLFEKKSREFPQVQEYLAKWESKDGHAEPFFIKNLENVQGDERDVIYISSTFGPRDGTGPVAQNFGPISKQGGWRRLNVLFTRAKHGVHLFTSMRPEDIVIDLRTPQGTQALRNYIEYARSGVLEGADPTEREPDSDFEVSVADLLRQKGFEVVAQLGVAGFFIDLAVRNPHRQGEYLAAIECDGASYHSAASVRDRDRIRQEILEGLGWKGKIFRIWSTDWYRSRATQVKKLLNFLEARQQDAMTTLPIAAPLSAPLAVPEEASSTTPLISHDLQPIAEASDELPFVEIGDTVTYILTAHPRDRKTVTIVDGPSDPVEHKLNHETPVATALLGLEIDGEEDLVVDGRRLGLIRVLKIEKPK